MSRLCEGKVVVVTGAARGLGRAHALEFARHGARVVVNDIGVGLDGSGGGSRPALDVAEEIRDLGGEAIVNGADVGDWQSAGQLIDSAVDAFGGLDVLVNNAGFVRDRMFVNLTESDWDDVVRVHLKGHAATLHHAAAYWRGRHKDGHPVDARVVNTTSGAGLLGSIGQTNYAAAKAGVVALTLNTAAELGRYGVTVNAIAPAARTRMTEDVFAADMRAPGGGAFDAMSPENVAPLVVWLGSAAARGVSGRVFEVAGGRITLADGWSHGANRAGDRRWEAAEIGDLVHQLIAEAPNPEPVYGAEPA